MATSKELDDIWKRIEEQRASHERIIAGANVTIENARALIKEAREGLDALPVAKVRRTRKGPVGVDGLRLPGALEMFPNGIERVEDDDV